MKDPLAFISESSHKKCFIISLSFTLLLLAIFQALNHPLITSAAPGGIISHQFAWTPEIAQNILSSWEGRVKLFAAFNLGFDFLFMISYAVTLSMGMILAAGRHPGRMTKLGTMAANWVFLAVVFDALENYLQVQQLLNGVITSQVTHLVGLCATIKFALIIFSIIFGLVNWVIPKK